MAIIVINFWLVPGIVMAYMYILYVRAALTGWLANSFSYHYMCCNEAIHDQNGF